MLLCSAAAVSKDLALLTQVLRVLFALVRHVQPVRFLQRTLEQRDIGAFTTLATLPSPTLMQIEVESSTWGTFKHFSDLDNLVFFS